MTDMRENATPGDEGGYARSAPDNPEVRQMTCVVENVETAADVDDVADNVQAELVELADSIDLPPGYRAEIINGSIVVSPTPTYRHARIVNIVDKALALEIGNGLEAVQVVTVELAATEERYVPDLVVLPSELVDGVGWDGPDWLRPAEAAEFVLEVVSRSSANPDWNDKVKGYASVGVPLYLVVDPIRQQSVLFSSPKGDGYAEQHRVSFGQSLHIPEPFDVDIDTALFQRREKKS